VASTIRPQRRRLATRRISSKTTPSAKTVWTRSVGCAAVIAVVIRWSFFFPIARFARSICSQMSPRSQEPRSRNRRQTWSRTVPLVARDQLKAWGSALREAREVGRPQDAAIPRECLWAFGSALFSSCILLVVPFAIPWTAVAPRSWTGSAAFYVKLCRSRSAASTLGQRSKSRPYRDLASRAVAGGPRARGELVAWRMDRGHGP